MMNTNRKYQFFVLLTLVAILLQAFTAHVSAAQTSEPYETAGPASTDCRTVLADAEAVLARIDVPKTRAEYEAMDRIAQCLLVAGDHITIPVTGRASSAFDSFLAVKDLQAELADRSGSTRSSPPATGYLDEDFLRFKLRQIERMSH